MTHGIPEISLTGVVAAAISAVLYIVLGIWVLTLKPRRRQTTLLGVFAVLFGMAFLPTDLGAIFHLFEFGDVLHVALQEPFQMLWPVAALSLVWAVPEPLQDRRLLGIAIGVGFGLALAAQAAFFAGSPGYETILPFGVEVPMISIGNGALFAAVVLLPLRARPAREPDPGEVTQLALLAVALAIFSAFIRGNDVVGVAEHVALGPFAHAVQDATVVLVWVLVAGLWGWNMVRADDNTVRTHRAAMLGVLASLTAGAVSFAAVPDITVGLMRGVVRTLGVALLAYGILRHDLAGLDAKVRFGVSKTTVAGVFVASFFIVSEGAQELLAGFAGSEFLGIIAAGALLFALAPIQKMGDRIAAKAVPGAREGSDEEIYRRTVAKYLVDGSLTNEEERDLGDLATRLGIDAGRAIELRQQVEDEIDGGDDP